MAANKSKEEAKTEVLKTTTEASFYVYELRENSQELFGVKPEVVDGALHGFKDHKITKSETRKRLKSFLSKEVK